jgi:hypothetical protein
MTMPFTFLPSEERLLLERMRAEWIEMPGMRLTAGQAARLWGLDRTVCDRALGVLVQSRFLVQAPCGAYRLCGGTRDADFDRRAL